MSTYDLNDILGSVRYTLICALDPYEYCNIYLLYLHVLINLTNLTNQCNWKSRKI